MLVTALSGAYALHQLVVIRNGIGILVAFVVLRLARGLALLCTRRARLHALRAVLVVVANLSFYAAIVAMPLAKATALYFIAPLLITVMSGPILGEWVGPRRALAVLVGFAGVLVMLWPQLSGQDMAAGWALVLPLIAAAGYAGMSVLTRKLGGQSRASAMAIYLQSAFILSSLAFFIIAGDERYLSPDQPAPVQFLLRAWAWPPLGDWAVLIGLGALSAGIGYTMSQAYRLGRAAVVAPFEYTLLIYATFWGWLLFAETPTRYVLAGAGIVIAAGPYVAFREERVGPAR